MRFLMLPHPLTNFEIQKYYQNEPRFNGVYSRNNLPEKIKVGAYVINLDEYVDVGTLWITLKVVSEIVYFDSFGVEHALEEIKEFIRRKNLKANIFRVQANNSIMCAYVCIGFIDFILAGKKLTDFMSFFSQTSRMNGIDKTNLTDQRKCRKISKIQNYFNQEISQRKLSSKTLRKYVAAFDYSDKVLIVLSATSGGVCIISSVSVAGAPVGISGVIFTLIFSLTTGIIKKLLSITRNEKKKHDKILILAKSKLDIIETLVSQALIDMEISHEKFNAIIREKHKLQRMKKM